MKKILSSILLIMLTLPVFSQHMEIEGYDLPNKSIEFLRTHYDNFQKYGKAIYCVEYDETKYCKVDDFEVYFMNGTIVEFYRNGNLKSITCGDGDTVPSALVPSDIKKAIKCYAKNSEIFKFHIEKGVFSRYYVIHFKDEKKIILKRNGKLKE